MGEVGEGGGVKLTAMHWTDELSPYYLRMFAIEIADAVEDAMQTGDYSKVVEAWEGWEATAEVMSSPELKAALERPIGERSYRPLSEFLASE